MCVCFCSSRLDFFDVLVDGKMCVRMGAAKKKNVAECGGLAGKVVRIKVQRPHKTSVDEKEKEPEKS